MNSSNKKLSIRFLRPDESYWMAYAGEFRKNNELLHYLSNSEVATLYAMKDLATSEEQFEVYCYAYLQGIDRGTIYQNKKILKKEEEYRNKYGVPWHHMTRHAVPAPHQHTEKQLVMTNGDFNVELLRPEFQALASGEYVIYRTYYKGIMI